MIQCPLCQIHFEQSAQHIQGREFFSCPECFLLFVDPKYFLNFESERKRYDQHTNHNSDFKYQKYIQVFLDQLIPRIKKGSQGLDFGCGPGPTISHLLNQQGYHVQNYDLHFFPDQNLLQKKYDFVTCTEVVEHFQDPQFGWKTLKNLLHSQSLLMIVTQVYDQQNLNRWHYLRDVTHVSLYSVRTMEWLARTYSWTLISAPDQGVFFFQV